MVIVEIATSVFFAPFFILLFVIILLASLGKSFGIRKLYVDLLLKLFEYGRLNIESANKRRQVVNNEDCDEDEDENEETDKPLTPPISPKKNTLVKKLSINGQSNGFSVISREALILVPDADNNKNGDKMEPKEIKDSTPSPKEENPYDFKLENCLDYVTAGMEAIIEDDVTSRFEAEELKNWNLLTRTNRRYEFISWRLTVMWVFGFFIRYTVLMPLRVIICFIGVAWCIFSFAVVGLVPFERHRYWLNDKAFKIAFRIIARSLSAVINIHNEEYKPRNRGFCVANHTSPIDVAILSTDCTYSLVYWLTICTAIVGCIPNGDRKRGIIHATLIHCFDFLSNAIFAVIYYHNPENRPVNGICVANHTSPIDALVLMCDNCYSLIGQRHGGFLGILQRALARASPHIWFERAESKDRSAVATRLKQHVSDPKNPPILIFPEGTCINNTSVMQFKKGSFEVGGVIYPVAIKYDARFGDAFWNSSRYSMMQYLYLMMTSWAIVCDVWYLPPMYREEGESAIDFANRVKSVIAKQGGLVDLVWDGQLKRMKPKKEWKEKQQEEFTKRLKGD
ncbi:unnamed protein product [Diamesa serratosioi]